MDFIQIGFIPVGGEVAETFKILLEIGDDLLAENGNFLIKE